MCPWRLSLVVFPIALVGCGGGDKPKATLSVTCGGSATLVGARSIDILGDLVNGRPTISFPDPANPGRDRHPVHSTCFALCDRAGEQSVGDLIGGAASRDDSSSLPSTA